MQSHKIVLPEHLNPHGYLVGGRLLHWVDEFALIAANLEYPGCNFVTIGLDRVEFRRSVREGAILGFYGEKTKEGKTFVRYAVRIFPGRSMDEEKDLIFSGQVTFVHIDEHGQKSPLPPGNA